MEFYNSQPEEDFEGFSPNEMFGLLYSPINSPKSCLKLNRQITEEKLSNICFIEDIRHYLERIQELQPFKLTAKGNLPRRFCRELIEDCNCEDEVMPFKIHRNLMREEDSNYLTLLNQFTRMMGLTKVGKNRISLTQKGGKLLNGPSREFFYYIFTRYCEKYGWFNEDYYPESPMIQGSLPFTVFLLQKYGGKKREASFYVGKFLKAFPNSLREFPKEQYSSNEKQLHNCYCLRVFERFMKRFHLVTLHPRKDDPHMMFGNYSLQKTPLIDDLFYWEREKKKDIP